MPRTEYRFGFWFASAALLAATGYAVAQLLQIAGVLERPWDEILIYGFSLGIAFPFMLAMLALHRLTPRERRLWSSAGLLFAAIYAAYVTPLYAVQLASGIPLSLGGTPDPAFAMARYTPLWTLDAMGYICMGLATLFGAHAFQAHDRWQRGFFLANGACTAVIAVVYFHPNFSVQLLLLGTPWLVTAPGAILSLAIWFRKEGMRLPGALAISARHP